MESWETTVCTEKKICILGGHDSFQKRRKFLLLTSILTAVKEGLKSYHNTCYSHRSINSMWILKNSKMFSKFWIFFSTIYFSSVVDTIFNKLCSSTCWPISSLLWGWVYSWSDPKEETGIWYIASTPRNLR